MSLYGFSCTSDASAPCSTVRVFCVRLSVRCRMRELGVRECEALAIEQMSNTNRQGVRRAGPIFHILHHAKRESRVRVFGSDPDANRDERFCTEARAGALV